jgi:hypothetical protein
LGSPERATEKYAEFEKIAFRAHEEVAGFARKHDRFVRGVYSLLTKGSGGFAHPFPSVPQVVGEVLCQSRFGSGPTIVLFSVLDPLLAVVALSTPHPQIVKAIVEQMAPPASTLPDQQRINRRTKNSDTLRFKML